MKGRWALWSTRLRKCQAFEVEFVAADGTTIAVLTLSHEDVRPIRGREILHVRAAASVRGNVAEGPARGTSCRRSFTASQRLYKRDRSQEGTPFEYLCVSVLLREKAALSTWSAH
jgi:hypothetical protein